MWYLAFVLIGTFLTGFSYANEVPEHVFTENGRVDMYPIEEDVVDGEGWPGSGSEYGGSDGEEVLDGRPFEEPKPIYKREGQEEFATFIDPAPSKRSVSQKQNMQGGTIEKRARVDMDGSHVGDESVGDTVFIAVTTVCTAAAVFGLIATAFIWRRVHNRHKAARESEYPHYGVTGPAKDRSGSTSPVAAMDAKLASSAQLYHYQHTKQQIIAMEQSTCESKGHDSDDSEGEEDEGDFSVYEYPGLAPTGDIEVTNPLFENASPKTKTDPKLGMLEPGVHRRRSEDQ